MRYFPVVLVIMLYKVVCESVDEILIKATELYFPKVLLVMLYKVVLAFDCGSVWIQTS